MIRVIFNFIFCIICVFVYIIEDKNGQKNYDRAISSAHAIFFRQPESRRFVDISGKGYRGMKLTKKSIQFCIDTVTARVAEMFAKNRNIPHTEALRFFIASKTFNLLIEPDSYLFLESAEYTLDMLESEIKGDWERWLLI